MDVDGVVEALECEWDFSFVVVRRWGDAGFLADFGRSGVVLVGVVGMGGGFLGGSELFRVGLCGLLGSRY